MKPKDIREALGLARSEVENPRPTRMDPEIVLGREDGRLFALHIGHSAFISHKGEWVPVFHSSAPDRCLFTSLESVVDALALAGVRPSTTALQALDLQRLADFAKYAGADPPGGQM